jgi:hypothetical protein
VWEWGGDALGGVLGALHLLAFRGVFDALMALISCGFSFLL